MSREPSSEPLEEAARDVLRGALGALLVDADVASVHASERGAVEVTRRGRRERLSVALPSEVFDALASLGARERGVTLSVDGHRLLAQPAAADRLVLYLEKRPPADARLSELVEEGVLPEDAAESVVAVARAGHGLVVVGTPRAATRRFAIAVARELAESAPVVALDPGLEADWLLPAPLVEGGVVERALAAERIGAEVLLAPSLSLDEAVALASARLSTSAVVMVRAPSAPALTAAFRASSSVGAPLADALASQLCVLGRAPGGRPVLVEQHVPEGAPLAGPVASASAPAIAPAPLASPSSSAPPPALAAPSLGPPPSPPSARAPLVIDPRELPPLPPLGSGPPAGWASSSPDDDPGWELGGGGRTEPSAFDDVLARVGARPTFTPRPPPVHPQTRALRQDPLGGLTLEPPGGALDDADENATPTGEDET